MVIPFSLKVLNCLEGNTNQIIKHSKTDQAKKFAKIKKIYAFECAWLPPYLCPDFDQVCNKISLSFQTHLLLDQCFFIICINQNFFLMM